MTVKSESYYIYTYIGRIKRNHIVKIVLSWPKSAQLEPKVLRCFISQDLQLSVKQILNPYTKRLPIELYFRETKQNFGFDRYQVRTIKGINPLMLLIQIMYLYLQRLKTSDHCMGDMLRSC